MERSKAADGMILRGAASVCFVVMTACASNPPGEATKAVLPDASNVEAIRNNVAKYARSVDNADTELAREVWADSEDISFIHPMGHERGWMQIKTNVYEKTMRDLLSDRKLTVRDLTVKLYGDAAVAEFYWVFDAKWRKDGRAVRTEGRETQVLRKGVRGTWELVHVHYSGMPVSSPSQGL